MTYTAAEARQQVLDVLAVAADELGAALASLGEAYEQLDDRSGQQLEEQLFRPVQLAYGRAKRTHADFATRYGLSGREFELSGEVAPGSGVKGLVEAAVEAAGRADGALVELQDSMLPVEVGDAELRSGVTQVRELLGPIRSRARELVRTFGR